jgi:fused signal recognition particle receptor
VARTWHELVQTPDGAGPPAAAGEQGDEGRGFFRRLRENMRRTREALGAEIRSTAFDTLDDEAWERLEELLIAADVGAQTTARIVERLEGEALSGALAGGAPGVNGTGKTTTIGKLAWHLQRELGRSVLLAAGDTYRAAAVEQLSTWAERAGCEIVRSAAGADPGSVAYDAIAAAQARGRDVVICDTAGRLHNQQHLMEELSKVERVIRKQIPDAPHETLLVVDATTGQNGLRQAELFQRAVGVSGVALTKLDGTAKGGIALAIADRLGLPVKLIGIGEGIEDLRPFDADDFARAILEA